MHGQKGTRDEVTVEAVVAARPVAATTHDATRNELDWHRAETDRLRVLVDFLARPIHAPGGSDPDPDVLTAYNLAVEAALNSVRHAATGPRRPAGIR
jgi:hypothetical protein